MRPLILVLFLIIGAACVQSVRNDCQWRDTDWVDLADCITR